MDDNLHQMERPVASPRDEARQGRDLSRYTMTAEEAVAEFRKAGVPVKLRSVQRYCRRQKLDCIKIDPDTREETDAGNGIYLIDPASVPRRIEQMLDRKEFAGTTERVTDATGGDMPRPAETERDQPRQDARTETKIPVRDEDMETLQDELQDARTQAAAHKAVAIQMRRDRDEAYQQLRLSERVVGIFQDRVMRLGGDPTYPQLDAPRDSAEHNVLDEPVGDNSEAERHPGEVQ
jgi:hypothetical protein